MAIQCYHGATLWNVNLILKKNIWDESIINDCLGKGIYFYADEPPNSFLNKKYIKILCKIKFNLFKVLNATISQERKLDLDNPHVKINLKKIMEAVKQKNVNIKHYDNDEVVEKKSIELLCKGFKDNGRERHYVCKKILFNNPPLPSIPIIYICVLNKDCIDSNSIKINA